MSCARALQNVAQSGLAGDLGVRKQQVLGSNPSVGSSDQQHGSRPRGRLLAVRSPVSVSGSLRGRPAGSGVDPTARGGPNMQKREVIRTVLDGGRPPYVPWSIGFTKEAAETLQRHYGADVQIGRES